MDSVLETVALVQEEIKRLEGELLLKKRMVNDLYALVEMPPAYGNLESASRVSASIRSDEFYGQPLAGVVRAILEKRKAANLGAASVAEIFAAMKEGGFDFGKTSDANAKRNLRISLTKNSSLFHRLPSNKYGLLAWYPKAKTKKDDPSSRDAGDDEDDDVGLKAMEDEFGPSEAKLEAQTEKGK